MNIWDILGVEATYDLALIKKAYAKKLKENKPETNPEGFQLLRHAYEIAQQYAAGSKISDEIKIDNVQTTINQEPPTLEEYSNKHTVSELIHDLLNLYEKDEELAVNKLKFYHESRYFDDFVFADHFQEILVTNLLGRSIRKYNFVCYAIEIFDWDNGNKFQTVNSSFRLGLANLLHRINPYRRLRNIFFLASIKTKKQAKELKLNWNDCYAARIMLQPHSKFKFRFINMFVGDKRNAIFNLVDSTITTFPEVIGMGLSISSYAWWHKKWIKFKTKKGVTSPFLQMVGGLIVFLLILFCFANSSFNEIVSSEDRVKLPPTNQSSKTEGSPNRRQNHFRKHAYTPMWEKETEHELMRNTGIDFEKTG
ncbi:MAG: J domain-containing protein [Gammaproteobacteria bacterium]|nr:J domain-containing protein [Gammaproteobacteria bacterium]